MQKFPEHLRGAVLVISASVLWGTAGTFAKFLFNSAISPCDLVQARATLSFVLLVVFIFFTDRSLLSIRWRDLPFFLVFGIFGLGLNQFAYMLAISQTNVATAIFLQYLAPALVLLYGVLRKTERITSVKLLALAFSVLGGYLIVRGTASGFGLNSLGVMFGLLAAFSYAFYNIYAKHGLARYHPYTLLAGAMGVSAIGWCVYQLPHVLLFRYDGAVYLQFLYIALMATIIPFGLYFNGLKSLSPFRAGLLSTMEPVVAAVTAFAFLGEHLNIIQVFGCVLILAGVAIIQRR